LRLEARRAADDEHRIMLSARDSAGKTVASARLELSSGETA
jgi:hypothetical protein